MTMVSDFEDVRVRRLSPAAKLAYRALRVRGVEPRATYTHAGYSTTLAMTLQATRASVEDVRSELEQSGLIFLYSDCVRVVDPGLAEGAEIFFQQDQVML